MSWTERVLRRLETLYGPERARTALPHFVELVERWRPAVAQASNGQLFDEHDIVLLAYPDHLQRPGEPPLATLSAFCREHLSDVVSTVHVLPFHPSTSYEGYAVTDYRAVDPAFGTWQHIAELSEHFSLMVDLVVNHCSSSHPWVTQLKADEEPGRRFVLTVEDPTASWLRGVHRARNSPLLTPVETCRGTRHVWTTYSEDLVDLNWREPDVCLEFLDVTFDAVVRGARIIRLDAFVYVWKEAGTTCVDRPEGHELVRLFQDVLAAAGATGVAILPSITNVTQQDNFAYFGADEPERQADLIYHLPLSALLLLSLYRHDATTLRHWLAELPPAPPHRAYFNMAATHDGIGLTWLRGVIPDEHISELITQAVARGALLSSRRRTVDGDDRPWELNATWFSACAPEPDEPVDRHVERVLATQAVVLALRGVPALYLPLFLAGANDLDRARRWQDNRAVNRGRYDLSTWQHHLADGGSLQARLFEGVRHLARVRRACPAFHPEGAQTIDGDVPAPVLAIRRRSPDGATVVRCLTNFGAVPCEVVLDDEPSLDLLTNQAVPAAGPLVLAPYRTAWLLAGGTS